jgi:hypothetical protein
MVYGMVYNIVYLFLMLYTMVYIMVYTIMMWYIPCMMCYISLKLWSRVLQYIYQKVVYTMGQPSRGPGSEPCHCGTVTARMTRQ